MNEARRISWREVGLLAAITIAVLLPFAGKALHIDDPLFVWAAEQIHRDPLDFYGFDVNWYGHPEPMADVTQNPPGASYFLALWAVPMGWSEVALHIAYLMPALAVTVGTLFLARRFCSRPLLAGLFVIATPVFVMSGTVLTSDLIMLALWVWAVELWLRGHDKRRPATLAAAMLLVAAAALTKYFAVSLIPLLLVDAWLRRRRRAALWLILPAAILGLYELATRSMYGHGLLSQAGGYTRHISRLDEVSEIATLGKALVGAAYAGGCLFVVLLFAPWLWSRLQLGAGLLAVLIAVPVLASVEQVYGFAMADPNGVKWWIVVHLAVFLAAGLGVTGLGVFRWSRGLSANDLLLSLWLLGTLVFASVMNWTVNGRSVLPALPAAGILLLQRLEQRRGAVETRFGVPVYATIAIGLALALTVAWADLRHANSARDAARRIVARNEGLTTVIRYQGHWGFQWYMDRLGAHALDLRHAVLSRGELLVLPGNSTAVRPPPRAALQLVDTVELPAARWVSTMSPHAGSGYYSARKRGPLPFAFWPAPPERYYVYRIIRDVNR